MDDQTTPQDNYDSPWKDILEHALPQFFEFFFPDIHAEIDWEKGYVFLDKEFDSMARDSGMGKRTADKLVQVWTRDGTPIQVFIHIEVQSQEETNFPHRMFVYNYRIYDSKNAEVVSLAILGDERETWRPTTYHRARWGCSTTFTFPIVKLTDYRKRWAWLEEQSRHNPFALIAMAHLKMHDTQHQANERFKWKEELSHLLYEGDLSEEDIRHTFRVLDWMLRLPEDLEVRYWQGLQKYEEEKNMPYITSIERIGMKRGLEQGIQQGRQEGLEEGLRLGIQALLKVRFGAESMSLMKDMETIKDVTKLEQIQQALTSVEKLDEVRKLLNSWNN